MTLAHGLLADCFLDAIGLTIKPEVVEFGGDYLRPTGSAIGVAVPGVGRDCYPELIRSTMSPPGPPFDRDEVGTSYAAPKVTRIAAFLQELLPNESTLLYRALIVQSARWPSFGWTAIEAYRNAKSQAQKLRKSADDSEFRAAEAQRDRLASRVNSFLRQWGYGVPNLARATSNNDHRVTLITTGSPTVRAGEAEVYQVPVPQSMRRPGNDHDVLVEVTLSYVAAPRRTRRTAKRYLAVWVDWTTNRINEHVDDYVSRVIDSGDSPSSSGAPDVIPWVLGAQTNMGVLRGVARSAGTAQKDWAVLKAHQLPESFCVAVQGHKGWSRDPDAVATYSLVVSFDVIGEEVAIYNDVRVALGEVDIEAKIDVRES